MDDHDLLIRMDEKMDAVLKRLEDNDTTLDDLEARVDALERFKSAIFAVVAVVSFVVSAAGTWFMSHFRFGG